MVKNNSKEAQKKWAEAVFRKEQRAQDGRAAMAEYETGARATREKTARLKALRLAKEAQARSVIYLGTSQLKEANDDR